MVRIINIDTKTRTIRVSNEEKDIDWITVKGTHVPIKKGESKGEAVEKFFEDKGRKFYRGSVVHKSGIDRQNIEVAEIRDRLKQWEHKLKKADTDGEKAFIKKAQEKLRKNLDYSKGVIKELSGDFEIDPYDKDMLKEFDDWKKSKQPAKKVKETYADTSEIDGAEVFKDGDDYVVLYANGTKTREFSSKTEADKFAKSLSKQPAKQESEEKAHRIATNLFSAINTSQFTDAQLKSLISSFIYDEADNLDDDGVVTKDELNSEEFKRLKKFVAEKLNLPAKKSAAQIFKDAGDDTGWKSIKSGSHHQFFDENNWAQREHEYVYLPDGDDSFDNYARIEKDTDGDPRVVVTLVKDGERVYKDPFDGYDDQAGNMQAAIEAVARAFGK